MKEIIIEPTVKHLTREERAIGILKDRYLQRQARQEKKFQKMGMDLKVDLLDKNEK